MNDVDIHLPLLAQTFTNGLRHCHRTVVTSCAAHADGDEILPFVAVPAQRARKQIHEAIHVLLRTLLVEHVIGHRLVHPTELAQLLNPVRVGQKADIENDVGIARGAVLEPEGLDGDVLPAHRQLANGRLHRAPQIVDRQVGRVDDHVGRRPQIFQRLPLVLDAARAELRKLDKPGNESDFRWLEPGEGSA